MIEVVAALIRDEVRFLICQRPATKARPLLWELPGGKLEPGETMAEALIRECREELGIVLSVGSVFGDTVYAYEDITIHLTVCNAAIAKGTPRLLEHSDLRWITMEEIQQFAFCPADEAILKDAAGKMPAGKCYRCGYCCQGCMVPRYADSDLSPAYLDSLALRFGNDYAARYVEENSILAKERCQWLAVNPDGITTSCTAYARRSAVCRMHNSDVDCVIGFMVMRQYGCL